MKDFCDEWNITIHFASVAHPQTNGLAESANKNILEPLRKMVIDTKDSWPEQLSRILWSYRIIHKTSTSETLFRFTHGFEAMLLVEVWMKSLRITYYDEEKNVVGLRANTDPLNKV